MDAVKPKRKGRTYPPLAERLKEKIDTTGECHLWTGRVNHAGYGTLGSAVRAHRAVWMLANGPIPHGFHVLHTCDVRHCCNPAHLFLGTHHENMLDMKAKRRAARGETLARTKRKLTTEQAAEIRGSMESGVALASRFNVTPTTITNIRKGLFYET